MREAVYEPFDTVVFTSATLTVNRSFQYWKTRIGLTGYEGAELREELFESPFDFKERVLIGVPSDAPAPESEDYRPFLARFIADALLISEGRALVLFTSYDMLIKTYESVRPAMDKAGISLFRQGDDERSRLLRRFNEDTTSVLFATDSFWEGVDSPGDTLLLVILCRLPFRVPTDPVLVARMEAIRLKGGNPFFDLSLPEAVMKLKQGFGRLMRRTSDRGAVLIPDGRIVTKNYGSIFLSSLPETRRSIKSAAALFEDLENFLAR
jgi:ATP-dependent DNA helicase DinG